MNTPSKARADLMNRREQLRNDLAECEKQIKREHMSWVVISSAYGHLLMGSRESMPYWEAWKSAAEHNSTIDWDKDKAYRLQVSIAGWRWLDTGELVHPGVDREKGFYDQLVQRSSAIEVPDLENPA